ncbi:caudovirales tail fiber assembly protein [Brachyspira sp. CAG:484]|nr:caudovirales tail fiber assembly protein [Brachyspira sp. CAG:484]
MKYFGFKENVGYGFYDENFDGAIQLSDEEWQTLLTEQSAGKDIVMFGGEVFASEPNLYYLDSNGVYQKYSSEELQELAEINQVVTTTNTALNFLNDTDWKVTRHRDQQAQGIETSLTEEEYQQLLVDRQNARDSVIRGEKYGNLE